MGFDRDGDAVIGGKRRGVGPIRNRLLVPLPLEHLEELRWPRCGDPVGMPGAIRIAGTSGERHHGRHLQFFGEAHRLPEQRVSVPGNDRIRVQRIAVAREGADGQAGVGQQLPIGRGAAVTFDHLSEVIEVRTPRPAAGPQFDRFHVPQRLHLRDHLGRREVSEYRCEYAQFHRTLPTSSAGLHRRPHPAATMARQHRINQARRVVPVLERGKCCRRRFEGVIVRSRHTHREAR